MPLKIKTPHGPGGCIPARSMRGAPTRGASRRCARRPEVGV